MGKKSIRKAAGEVHEDMVEEQPIRHRYAKIKKLNIDEVCPKHPWNPKSYLIKKWKKMYDCYQCYTETLL